MTTRLGKILDLMLDGVWRTAEEVRVRIKEPPESLTAISAQLRDLRKEGFGSYEMPGRWRGERSDGVYEYRMTGRKVDPAQKKHDHNHEKCPGCAKQFGEGYQVGKAAASVHTGQVLAP